MNEETEEAQFQIYPLEKIPLEYYPLVDWIRWRLFNGKLTHRETILVYDVLKHPELQDQIAKIISDAEEADLIWASVNK